jgi:ABC-type cobalamin/Fe3+-siderophores transport system ATPase subunit
MDWRQGEHVTLIGPTGVGKTELMVKLAGLRRWRSEEALSRAFWQTGWTVLIDELEYINRDLKIDSPVNRLLRQGRSQGNSMVVGTQRPRYVTLHAYEQATHLFMWRQADLSNITRASELAGVNRAAVLEVLPHLSHHDALYVNTITGDMFVTNTRA